MIILKTLTIMFRIHHIIGAVWRSEVDVSDTNITYNIWWYGKSIQQYISEINII